MRRAARLRAEQVAQAAQVAQNRAEAKTLS